MADATTRIYFFLFYLLFLAALGLHCCAWASSSCRMAAPHWGSFSCCGAQALKRGLGSGDSWLGCASACGIFLGQGSNHVPCIGRQILNYEITREVLFASFLCQFSFSSSFSWFSSTPIFSFLFESILSWVPCDLFLSEVIQPFSISFLSPVNCLYISPWFLFIEFLSFQFEVFYICSTTC